MEKEKLHRLKQNLARGTIELLEKLDPELGVYVAYLYPGSGMLLEGYAISANEGDYLGETLSRLIKMLKAAGYSKFYLEPDAYNAEVEKAAFELATDDGFGYSHLPDNMQIEYDMRAEESLGEAYWYDHENGEGALSIYQMSGESFNYDLFMSAVNAVINEGVELECYPGYVAPDGIQAHIHGYEKHYGTAA